MGDPARAYQSCIPPGLLNRVPALIDWGKGGNVTSARWQVTLCDPIKHVSSRSGEAYSRTAIPGYFWLMYSCFVFAEKRSACEMAGDSYCLGDAGIEVMSCIRLSGCVWIVELRSLYLHGAAEVVDVVSHVVLDKIVESDTLFCCSV